MMIFAVEFQRQSDERGWGISGNSAQPIGSHAAMVANATEVTPSMSWYRRALGLVPQTAGDGKGNGALENLKAVPGTTREEPRRVDRPTGPGGAGHAGSRSGDGAEALGSGDEFDRCTWPEAQGTTAEVCWAERRPLRLTTRRMACWLLECLEGLLRRSRR